MSTLSTAPPPKLLDRSRAMPCLLVNLLVIPGIGSLMAKRASGWVQLLLALSSMGIILVWLFRLILAWSQTFVMPTDWRDYEGLALGLVVFALAWVWSLVTG